MSCYHEEKTEDTHLYSGASELRNKAPQVVQVRPVFPHYQGNSYNESRAVKCGRCASSIPNEYMYERCWWCKANLCSACWANGGHCGHEGADEINEQSKLWTKEQCRQMLKALYGGEK